MADTGLEILVAKSAGFCFGVKRAVEQAEALSQRCQGRRVVTLGPLVHNPQEVERLRELGVDVVGEDEVQQSDAVVVRTHGLPAEMLRRLESRAEVHNTTCPYVRAVQTQARRIFAEAGREDAASPAPVLVVSRAEEVQCIESPEERRVAVLAQTTMNAKCLRGVADECLGRFHEIRIFNTICEATQTRQREAGDLARAADVVLVVGGRRSANTGRLAALCAEIQPRTFRLEDAGEIEDEWLQGALRVAVTAGASTPHRIVEAVVKHLEQWGGSLHHRREPQSG
jgi:4-hydroxy-3-methylbut-2-enyl diphosphate reductase